MLSPKISIENYLTDLSDLADQIQQFEAAYDRNDNDLGEVEKLKASLDRITRNLENLAVIYTDVVDRFLVKQPASKPIELPPIRRSECATASI